MLLDDIAQQLKDSYDNTMTRPAGLRLEGLAHVSKVRLLEAGLELLLAKGYPDTSI